MHAAGRTPVKLPAFLRATMICGADRGPRGVKGDSGKTGATGARGADGANGGIGQPGPAGTNGINGAQGAPGTNGINGTNGRDGADGAPGPAATRDYAYLYDVAGQTVAPSGDVLFRTDGPMTGEFTPHTGKFCDHVRDRRNLQGGDLDHGHLEEPGWRDHQRCPSGLGAIFGTDDNSQQNGGQAIISVGAGQVMTIRNQSTTTSIPRQHRGRNGDQRRRVHPDRAARLTRHEGSRPWPTDPLIVRPPSTSSSNPVM